jgi:Cohesin domain
VHHAVQKLLAPLLIALVVVAAPASAAQVFVGVPAGNPPPNSQFTIEITVNVGTAVLGSYDFTFRYDPAVIHVVSIAGGTTSEFGTVPTTNPATFASGTTRFVAAQASTISPTGNVSVARLTLQTQNISLGSSDLVLDPASLFDGSASPLAATVLNSSVLTAFDPTVPTTTSSTSTTTSSSTSSTSTSSTSTTSTTSTTTSSTSIPTTTSTSITTTSSTPAPSTTSTTLPPPTEACGNCLDDDGDGAIDYEDPDCCAAPVAMQVTKGKLTAKAGALKLLAQAGLAGIDPTQDDVSVQVRNANGELVCTTIPRSLWKKKRKAFAFRDPGGSHAGITALDVKPQKSGAVKFSAAGKGFDVGRFDGPSLGVTLRVGESCTRGNLPLRKTKKGLVGP